MSEVRTTQTNLKREVPGRNEQGKRRKESVLVRKTIPLTPKLFSSPDRGRQLYVAPTGEPGFASNVELEDDLLLFHRLAKVVLGTGGKGPHSARLLRRAGHVWKHLRSHPEDPRHAIFLQLGVVWRRLVREAPCLCENGDLFQHDQAVSNSQCGFCGTEGSRDDDEPMM